MYSDEAKLAVQKAYHEYVGAIVDARMCDLFRSDRARNPDEPMPRTVQGDDPPEVFHRVTQV